MPLVIALVIVVCLMFATWVAIAHERGPQPADVAIAYERAWDELDFRLLWDLSGDELRDGMRRDQYMEAKRAAYASTERATGAVARVEVETAVTTGKTALVVTRVFANGGSVRNNVAMEQRANGWLVVAYSLRPETDAGAGADATAL